MAVTLALTVAAAQAKAATEADAEAEATAGGGRRQRNQITKQQHTHKLAQIPRHTDTHTDSGTHTLRERLTEIDAGDII